MVLTVVVVLAHSVRFVRDHHWEADCLRVCVELKFGIEEAV